MKQREFLRVVGAGYEPVIIKPALPEQDAELYAQMVEAYAARKIGALRYKPASVNGELSQVQDLLNFTGKPPWMWNEEDFDQWCKTLGVERKVAVATQRKYQNAIKNFLAYITENVKIRNEVHRLYGVYPSQICNSENCIPHLIERELAKERPALSHAQIDQFFGKIDEAIQEAGQFGSKDLRPLQRDKALFFTVYSAGLRASEALSLKINSFRPNPIFPEFGEFGFLSVWGKGSRGSGPKHRMVPITHALLPQLLQWYISHIRPHFMRNADANEAAMFLSERGSRLGLSTLEARFQHIIQLSGLEGLGFTPHSMRHSSVTHESMRFSTEAVRIKHGHTFASTTQGYNHIPDDFVRDEIDRGISAHLDAILGKVEGNTNE